jgi:low affinity Fe/Cu permease
MKTAHARPNNAPEPQLDWFSRFAQAAARAAGKPATFLLAAATVVAWAASGPFFGFSEAWQIVINTVTTIVTFLMVFLIQNTQNRDTAAMQIKLDELIRALDNAHNALLDLEELEDADLERIRKDYERLAAEARNTLRKGEKEPERSEPRSDGLDRATDEP